MAVRVFGSLEDLEAAVGEELGTTGWVEVSQQTVDGFAYLTGDHQWIHVDVEHARQSSFGGTIAHGYLTLSMLPAFSASLYSIEAGTARLNYGLEKVRFPASVPVGSSIRASATVKQVRRARAGTQILFHWVVEAQKVDRPVCVADTITLVLP